MNHLYFFLTLAIAIAHPATQPTTQPVWASLADGEVRYTQPVGWTVLPSSNNLQASFKSPDDVAIITLQSTPQQQPLPNTPAAAQSIGKMILKAIHDDLTSRHIEVLEEPKLQRDPRFLVRIHDKIRSNGTTTDRLHLYRPIGYQFVMVAIDVNNQQDAAHIKAAITVGEDLLGGTVAGKRERKPASRPIPPLHQ